MQIKKLSLPYPIIIPILNFCSSVLILGSIGLSSKHLVVVESRLPPTALVLSSQCATFGPLVLLALSAVYVIPSDLRTCSSETQWAHMFRRKDEAAISFIQHRLHCCGFNSVQDRAWPFPSRGIDARACEQTQGYLVPCVETWGKQAAMAAALGGLASFLNTFVLVSNCTMY